MRYKIQKEPYVHNNKIYDRYYVLYEKKVWWKRKTVWKYCREWTYSSMDDWQGDRISFNLLKDAENFIIERMKIDNVDLSIKDIKIYECREEKLDKLLQ